MKHFRSIQRCMAALLGLVLLLGILPKPVVHEWLTGHAHQTISSDNSERDHIETAGTVVNCSCLQAEFSASFLVEPDIQFASISFYSAFYSTDLTRAVFNDASLQDALRGPPSIA